MAGAVTRGGSVLHSGRDAWLPTSGSVCGIHVPSHAERACFVGRSEGYKQSLFPSRHSVIAAFGRMYRRLPSAGRGHHLSPFNPRRLFLVLLRVIIQFVVLGVQSHCLDVFISNVSQRTSGSLVD